MLLSRLVVLDSGTELRFHSLFFKRFRIKSGGKVCLLCLHFISRHRLNHQLYPAHTSRISREKSITFISLDIMQGRPNPINS